MFEGNRYSRKGYLYKNFVMNAILVEGVKPTLAELEKFEQAPKPLNILMEKVAETAKNPESPLESLHYFMRIFEKYQSRKMSTEACLYDTMKRLYLKSCQLVRSQRLEKKPANHEISFLSQDDKIVQSFFISNQIEE